MVETAVPSPISTAFTAPMDIMRLGKHVASSLSKYRFSKTSRYAVDSAFDHTACTILILSYIRSRYSTGFVCCQQDPAYRKEFLLMACGSKLWIWICPDGTGISAQRDAHFGKNPGGNGSGSHTAYSFTARRTSTATVITEAVFAGQNRSLHGLGGRYRPDSHSLLTVDPYSIRSWIWEFRWCVPEIHRKGSLPDHPPAGRWYNGSDLACVCPESTGYHFSCRGSPAGHPSTTAPRAFPWDSPQVVTVNLFPKDDLLIELTPFCGLSGTMMFPDFFIIDRC